MRKTGDSYAIARAPFWARRGILPHVELRREREADGRRGHREVPHGYSRVVLCCVVYFLPEELAPLVQPIREKYDPTAHIIDPHVTLVFPADVAREVITRHVHGVLSRWDRFAVRFRGLSQSWDQWLFLDLDEESEAHMTRLHDDLYTGILTPHLSRSISYTPHVGLGHFGHPDERYDPLNPHAGPLDGDRYEHAYAEATALQIDSDAVVEHLDLVGVADAATEVECITRFALGA